MPGTFTYTVATNKIVVTNGTSGAPATFNDMYTADQAGTGTILNVAENGAAAVTLDYQIRPTHTKALIIKCIVTLKTAEADYIFITGTDAWGTAQTESLDVTAGNGTYTTTKRFKTITNLDCSDNAAGGGTVWADGKIAVTQDIWGVVWEYVADAKYKIDCHVDFGNGVTATYFQSKDEQVYFADTMNWKVLGEAIVKIGDLAGSYGITGSCWDFALSSSSLINNANASLYVYASLLRNRSLVQANISNGTTDFRNSILCQTSNAAWQRRFVFETGEHSLNKVYFNTVYNLPLNITPVLFSGIQVHNTTGGIAFTGDGTVTAEESVISTFTNDVVIQSLSGNGLIILKDLATHVSVPLVYAATDAIIEQYTCNIHVADEDGADLQTVTVQCQTFGNVVSNDAGVTFYKCIVGHTSGVFATDLAAAKWQLTTAAYAAKAGCTGGAGNGAWVTGIAYVAAASKFSVATDSGGDIAEQTIDYKKWIGTSEALLTYSPHTFTLTYGGDTHIAEDFTVDHPIVWHLEFPPMATLLSAIYAATITNAAGTDIAADIIALKAETVTILADTNEIQGKLPTNKIMGSSDVDNHDTDIDAILVDTNEIQGKLPDDYIMGSSVTTSMDDEINNINANAGKVVYGSVAGTGGVPKPIQTGSVTGFVEDEKL